MDIHDPNEEGKHKHTTAINIKTKQKTQNYENPLSVLTPKSQNVEWIGEKKYIYEINKSTG